MGLVISLLPALILRMPVLQGIGGGDIKFMMALGSFYGPSLPFFYVLGIGSIAAVVGGLVQLIRARQLVTYILLRPFGVPDLEAATVPFGTYLALRGVSVRDHNLDGEVVVMRIATNASMPTWRDLDVVTMDKAEAVLIVPGDDAHKLLHDAADKGMSAVVLAAQDKTLADVALELGYPEKAVMVYRDGKMMALSGDLDFPVVRGGMRLSDVGKVLRQAVEESWIAEPVLKLGLEERRRRWNRSWNSNWKTPRRSKRRRRLWNRSMRT
jgi:hypothetical protein